MSKDSIGNEAEEVIDNPSNVVIDAEANDNDDGSSSLDAETNNVDVDAEVGDVDVDAVDVNVDVDAEANENNYSSLDVDAGDAESNYSSSRDVEANDNDASSIDAEANSESNTKTNKTSSAEGSSSVTGTGSNNMDKNNNLQEQELSATATELKRKDSLRLEKEAGSLGSIADSIRLIYRRDSEKAVFQEVKQKSPWRFDSVVKSPMVSSPRYVVGLPDLQKRRETQIKKHDEKKRMARAKAKAKAKDREQQIENEMEAIQKRDRAISLGSDPLSRVHGETDHLIEVQTEDEQWERKRLGKLKNVIQKSISGTSLASMGGDSDYSPSQDILATLREEFANDSNPPGISIMYGLVNGVIVLPVIMSFGNIIFHDEFFRPYLPILVKLTVISGVVHQLCFSIFSTLPFAVGSVQDAGLIFLSAIASDIVRFCREKGSTDEEILATTLIGLPIFTVMLGTGLIIIGRLKLAGYVQALPMPVVGGYLAFIGFFCGQSALSLLSSVEVAGLMDWYKFITPNALMLMSPGIIGGFGIYIAVRNIQHMAVLPMSIVLLVTLFYFTLSVTDTSLEDAKDVGWMSSAESPPVWYHTWDYIQFDKVVWDALPGQLTTVLSMIIVVALSSSLDIAAIDLELPKPLEYNYELRMVGLSNVISGLTGGYTGSYIFSQTIFSLRAGIRSRLCGYVIALMAAITVVMPFSILDFVPNFIFASLLIMICVDLMIEWLWDVRLKLGKIEYSVTLLTFSAIQVGGVEYGIIAGIIFYMIFTRVWPSEAEADNEQLQATDDDETAVFQLKEEKYDTFGIMDKSPADIEQPLN